MQLLIEELGKDNAQLDVLRQQHYDISGQLLGLLNVDLGKKIETLKKYYHVMTNISDYMLSEGEKQSIEEILNIESDMEVGTLVEEYNVLLSKIEGIKLMLDNRFNDTKSSGRIMFARIKDGINRVSGLHPGTREIKLNGNGMNMYGFQDLCQLFKNIPRGAKTVDLNGNRFGDRDVEQLKVLFDLLPVGLEKLILTNNEFDRNSFDKSVFGIRDEVDVIL